HLLFALSCNSSAADPSPHTLVYPTPAHTGRITKGHVGGIQVRRIVQDWRRLDKGRDRKQFTRRRKLQPVTTVFRRQGRSAGEHTWHKPPRTWHPRRPDLHLPYRPDDRSTGKNPGDLYTEREGSHAG